MTLATDTLWFDAAVMATAIALGHCLLGHFEERTSKWRKMGKLLASVAGAVLISATLGRVSFFALFGLGSLFVLYIHAWWLPRRGINGWTGEPRNKYYELRGWKQMATGAEPHAAPNAGP
ncbi:MAG TPA: hypothetical protein VD866_11385 [Urbifossiella sp.]|nr:hypothetical protein [Urbifossiella sp.]